MSTDNASGGRTKAGLFGRGISATGLLIVCVSFYLPQFDGCGGHPVRSSFHSHGFPVDFRYLIGFGMPFTLAFVIVGLRLLRVLVNRRTVRRALTVAIVVVCLAALLAGPIMMSNHLPKPWTRPGAPTFETRILPADTEVPWSIATGAVAGVFILACIGLMILRARAAPSWCLACCGLASCAYGGYWLAAVPDQLRTGFWISLAGYALVTAGALLETRRRLLSESVHRDSQAHT